LSAPKKGAFYHPYHLTSANFLAGMLKSIPPFDEIFRMAGLELPEYLIGAKRMLGSKM